MTKHMGVGLTMPGLSKPVSKLVLGTAFYRLAERERWFAILDRFQEIGGTTIDSAHGYGESEKVVGAWLHSRKAAGGMLVITKCAHGNAILPEEGFEQVVEEEVLQSHRDLGLETIELLFLHRDNPSVPVARIMSKLAAVVRAGHARLVGASNWSYDRIDEANSWAARNGCVPFTAVSNNLSLGRAAAPFYPNLVSTDAAGQAWHQRTRVPLFPWSSQARGFFTGRWPREPHDQPGAALNAFDARMREVYCTDANYERLGRSVSLGREKGGFNAMQVALAWVLSRPFPVAPVVGPHTTEELESCANALTLDLTPSECRWLDLEE